VPAWPLALGKETMTPKQLREWLFKNSQDDQWWISLDAVTDDCPVTVKEIEERLKSGQYAQAQVLHVSQTELSNPPWIEAELPAPIQPLIVSPEPRSAPLPVVAPIVSPATVHSQPQHHSPSQPLKNPGVAAVLSFFFPGLGQIYHGQIVIGIVLFPLTIALYFMIIGIALHLYWVYDAYTYATKMNNQNA
jgi:TM2 domain-containing membrane protein YozV